MASRDWLRIYRRLLTSKKFLALSMERRGEWITVLLLSIDTEGVFDDGPTLVDLLGRYGSSDPRKAVAELRDRGLLEVTPTDCRVHDWAQWQGGSWRGPSDNPEQIAARVAAFRERKKADTNGNDPVTTRVRGSEVNGRDIGSSLRSEPTAAPRRPSKPSARQTVLAWLTEHKVAHPVGYVSANLGELVKVHGPDRVIASLAADKSSRTVKQFVAALERDLSPPVGVARTSPAKSNGSRAADSARLEAAFGGKPAP